VATSLNQFCRSIGSTLGSAVFGNILILRFSTGLNASVPPAVADWLDSSTGAGLRDPQSVLSPDIPRRCASNWQLHSPIFGACGRGAQGDSGQLASALPGVLCGALVMLCGLISSICGRKSRCVARVGRRLAVRPSMVR
jgi:hypothetical protein